MITTNTGEEAGANQLSGHEDVLRLGVTADSDDFTADTALELEFLTALVWAPVEESRRVVHALVGDRSVRAVSDQPLDAIPLSSALFLSPTHQAVFGAVVDLVDTDTPLTPRGCQMVCVSPVLISERKIYEHGVRRQAAGQRRPPAAA